MHALFPSSSLRRRGLHAAGLLLVLGVGLGLAELYLRAFPPDDLQDYLGDASPLAGPFVPEPGPFRLRYPGYEELEAANPGSLGAGPLEDGAWLFFGTSFVHMRGALRDTVAELYPTRTCLKLDRREPLVVRLAQIRCLLESGHRPDRIVLVLMPVDIGLLATHDLASIEVNDRGAMVLTPRLPPAPLAWLVQHSRLALTAWTRTGWHQPFPGFARHDLYNEVPAHLREDLATLFGELHDLARDVPVTLLFIPTYKQAHGRARHEFQDVVVELADAAGLDTVDLRPLFVAARDPDALYIHDGHLSKRGYRVAARELMRHLGLGDQVVWPPDEVEEP
jgi:hypothetical protein